MMKFIFWNKVNKSSALPIELKKGEFSEVTFDDGYGYDKPKDKDVDAYVYSVADLSSLSNHEINEINTAAARKPTFLIVSNESLYLKKLEKFINVEIICCKKEATQEEIAIHIKSNLALRPLKEKAHKELDRLEKGAYSFGCFGYYLFAGEKIKALRSAKNEKEIKDALSIQRWGFFDRLFDKVFDRGETKANSYVEGVQLPQISTDNQRDVKRCFSDYLGFSGWASGKSKKVKEQLANLDNSATKGTVNESLDAIFSAPAASK